MATTTNELLKILDRLVDTARHDPEQAHIWADEALLEYVDEPEISEAFHKIRKWYA